MPYQNNQLEQLQLQELIPFNNTIIKNCSFCNDWNKNNSCIWFIWSTLNRVYSQFSASPKWSQSSFGALEVLFLYHKKHYLREAAGQFAFVITSAPYKSSRALVLLEPELVLKVHMDYEKYFFWPIKVQQKT
jgi:hypothetical protein